MTLSDRLLNPCHACGYGVITKSDVENFANVLWLGASLAMATGVDTYPY